MKNELVDHISSITGISTDRVSGSIRAIESGAPTDSMQAREIIDSDFSTYEEKETARLFWKNLSIQEIGLADTIKKAQNVFNFINLKDQIVVVTAITKLAELANAPDDLGSFRFYIDRMSEEARKAHNDIVHKRLLEMAISFELCIKIWKDFKYASIQDSKELIELTRAFMIEIAESPTETNTRYKGGLSLYKALPKGHPIRQSAFIYGLDYYSTEEQLRELHNIFNSELEKTNKSLVNATYSSDKEPLQKESKLLEILVKMIVEKLDYVTRKKHENELDEDILYSLYRECADDPELPATKEYLLFKLHTKWSLKLSSTKWTFAEAFDIYVKARSIEGVGGDFSKKFWKIAVAEAKTKDECTQLIETARFFDELLRDAVRVWLRFDLSFDEILKVCESSNKRFGLSVLIKKAKTFDQKIELLKISDDEAVVKTLVEDIKSLKMGLKALREFGGNILRNDHTKETILKSTLPFIEDEEDLRTVRKLLEEHYLSKVESRLLVQGALKLFGEPNPTEPVASSIT